MLQRGSDARENGQDQPFRKNPCLERAQAVQKSFDDAQAEEGTPVSESR